MLKEIVDFSKKLEVNKIYDLIQEENQKIDKPIFVIPVNDDLTEIEIDKSYFVFKDVFKKEDKLILTLDGNRNKENTDYKLKEVKIEFDEQFRKILLPIETEKEIYRKVFFNIDNYSKKPSNDAKGNKSIGSNNGTNSYTVLIFTAKFETLMKNKETFFKKMKNTYTENFLKGLPEDLETIEIIKRLFKQLSQDNILQIFWDKVLSFKEKTEVKGNSAFNSINCIIKLPEKNLRNENYYSSWYDKYLSKKLFKTDPPNKDKGYPVKKCSICNEKTETWLPNAFHNLDSKKPFVLHLNRKSNHNLAVCSDCSFEIYKFQEFFLNKKGITVFPLFITDEFKKREIQFLKNDLTKISFSNILREVVKENPNDVFDFYLIIYNRDSGFLNFDYISGFRLNYNGKSIFEIEQKMNELFFEYKLQQNYFSKKVDSKNANLDNLIYRYRTQIFDFVYRVKDSINCDDISDMYFQTLQRRLRDCYKKDKEAMAISNINNLKLKFLELNKTLGGSLMQTVERIKKSGKVTDLESLSYYIGQIVKILLKKSQKDTKTHSMVEPFINITNFGVLGLKLQETFNNYKHSIYLNDSKFNQKMSEIFSFLYDNQKEEFNRDYKILFYAGYFDENNVYLNTNKEN